MSSNEGDDRRSQMEEADRALTPEWLHNYKLTSSERIVMDECNKEATFYRALPLSTLMASVAATTTSRGGFRFYGMPIVIATAFVGYMIGKLTFQKECVRRLMELPDSEIGRMFRKKYDMLLPQDYAAQRVWDDVATSSTFDPSSNLTEDSLHRPSSTDSFIPDRNVKLDKPTTTYEELRKKNRKDAPKDDTSSLVNKRPPAPPVPKNKYGDKLE